MLQQQKLKIKKSDIDKDKENSEKCQVVFFDLQKTLPTPLVSTNKDYYLRQLWTYNFGVHETMSSQV